MKSENPSQLEQYVISHAQSPHPYLETIRKDCLTHKWHFMLSTPDQVAFLYSLCKMIDAKKILEIGSYYGHSTLALAASLPVDGVMISIEHNPKFAAKTREHLQNAGLSDHVEILVAEGLPAITQLSKNCDRPYDLIFLDADKRHLSQYWEMAITLLRPRGVIVVDNVLARGEILNESIDPEGHVFALREFNEMAMNDSRMFSYIATIADGMLVAFKHAV